MHFYRIWAVARKETIHILRDWRSLVMAVVTPLFLLTIFGYALTLDVDNVHLIVWDQSQTESSRELIDRFAGSRYFKIVGYANNYHAIERSIDTNEALIALVIPVDFDRSIFTGSSAPVQLIVDGTDSNTATIALGYAESISNSYSQKLVLEELRRDDRRPAKPAVDLRSRVWFNPDLESKYNIVPGLIAVLMMVVSALLTSLTIAREWERGTMEQLISTPIKVPELLIGKLLPYYAIGIFDMIVIVIAGYVLFDVIVKGSILLLFVMGSIFLVGSLSLGLIISIVTKSQLVASQLAMVTTFLPSFLLTGFISTISNMPTFVQYLTYFVPARYFLQLLKAIYLKGVGLSVFFFEAVFLIIFSVAAFLIALKSFKKKLV